MLPISWNNISYKIDGKSQFLISGEFHYFRVPKTDWEKRLKLFKDAGGNCVATYIPWILHEPVEGDIRFGDIPERDLESFLNLCGRMDIFVICRPGPYQYSEMKYDGLPGWLCKNYPEILARDVNGNILRNSSVSYLHPLFLEKAKKWFDKVCPIISAFTLIKGGPVAFVQFDNELMGVHEWFGGMDYNHAAMGIGMKDGFYPLFLEKKYKNINNLNASYNTEFNEFKDVLPVDNLSARSFSDQLRCKDYRDFYFSSAAEYALILTEWMRESGINSDFIHNSANPNMNPYFLETVSRMGNQFLLGSDHYYNLDMDWEGNNPTPKYAVKVFYSLEMLRLMGFPPTVFELPSGSCSEWPPITTHDLKCCYMTNIAFGAKGINYYVFTGGPNPLRIGANGDSYDYGAPIGADGSIRPLYHTQKEFHEFLYENSWLAEAERISDFNIGLDWGYSRSRNSVSSQLLSFSESDAWSFLQKGLLITSLCSSFAPEFLDLYNDSFITEIEKPLLVASSESMPESVQKNLVGFVESGGKLLITPVLPHLDENYNTCTILKDFLGCNPELCSETFPRLNVGTVRNVLSNTKLFTCQDLPMDCEKIAVEENSGTTAGFKRKYPGGGSVIWLGICWKHSKIEHSKMLVYLLEELECTLQVVDCSNPNIWTALRSNNDKHMLFAMNLFSSPMEALIKVRIKGGSIIDTGSHSFYPMEVKTIII